MMSLSCLTVLIQCQIFKIIFSILKKKKKEKKKETLSNNTPIHIYIKMINNRLVFSIKDGYKLELHTPEIMELFGSTKNLIDKTRNGENVPES